MLATQPRWKSAWIHHLSDELPQEREWYTHVYRSLRATVTKELQNTLVFCQKRWGRGVFCHFLQNTSVFCFRRPPPHLPPVPVLPRDREGGCSEENVRRSPLPSLGIIGPEGRWGEGVLLKQNTGVFWRKCWNTPPLPGLLAEQVLKEDGGGLLKQTTRCSEENVRRPPLPSLGIIGPKGRWGGRFFWNRALGCSEENVRIPPPLFPEQVLKADGRGKSSETDHWMFWRKCQKTPSPISWHNRSWRKMVGGGCSSETEHWGVLKKMSEYPPPVSWQNRSWRKMGGGVFWNRPLDVLKKMSEDHPPIFFDRTPGCSKTKFRRHPHLFFDIMPRCSEDFEHFSSPSEHTTQSQVFDRLHHNSLLAETNDYKVQTNLGDIWIWKR